MAFITTDINNLYEIFVIAIGLNSVTFGLLFFGTITVFDSFYAPGTLPTSNNSVINATEFLGYFGMEFG